MKIKLKVHANSSQEKIIENSANSYEIWIKQKPVDGKANIYLEKILKKHFKKNVKITSGLTSKNKIIQLE
ncbi:DUF167 domain-containing protein [Candidatus Pacearchaeota archaeon]|nr:DUF167 domain-containing protein [Candidatus Pacearchaeota archaeon]